MSGRWFQIPPDLVDDLAARVAERITPQRSSEPWLNVEQAAEHLACTRRRIYDLVEREAVISYRDGRRLLFRRADLDAYVSVSTEGDER